MAALVGTEETVAPAEDDDDTPEVDPKYSVAAKASVGELLSKDADDAELAKYKAKLLGLPEPGSAGSHDSATDANAKHVDVIELRLHFEGRAAPLVIPLGAGASEGAGAAPVYVLKEGQDYRMELVFKVSKEICLGLKFLRSVYRRGIRVDKEQVMIGSYPPNAKEQVFGFPVDTVPSGMLARGSYVARIVMQDDDGVVHVKTSYRFKIAKTWS